MSTFTPPRCPHRDCTAHKNPVGRFCCRWGSYPAACRPRRIPRFRCKSCRRTFSTQTLRADYCDKRPDLNVPLLQKLTSGLGLRETSRQLGLSLRCTELKARKYGRHLRRLQLNALTALPEGSQLMFDEFYTFEYCRSTRPLSIPFVMESTTRMILWAESATVRPLGPDTPRRAAAIARDEARYGPRKDRSGQAIARTLERAAACTSQLREVVVATDEKPAYTAQLQRAFGAERLVHHQTSGDLRREAWNPLFPINHEENRMRDLCGRTRRQSWLASKRRRWLDLGLQLYLVFRNFVRPRFNGDSMSPAALLGLVPRRLRPEELLSWRQDWGPLSLPPLGRSKSSGTRRRKQTEAQPRLRAQAA